MLEEVAFVSKEITTATGISATSGVAGQLATLTTTALAANSSLELVLSEDGTQDTLIVVPPTGTYTGGGGFYVDGQPFKGNGWVTLQAYDPITGVPVTIANAPFVSGFGTAYRFDCGGMQKIRIRASGSIDFAGYGTAFFTALAYKLQSLSPAQLFGAVPNPLPVISTPKPSANAAVTNVASNAANVTLLAANAARLGATIFNNALSGNLYAKCGATATTTTSFTVKIVPGAYWEVPFAYTGQIDGIWDTADGNGAVISELTA